MIFASLMSSHIRAIPMLSFFTWLSPVFSSSLELQGQFVEVEKWVLQTADAFRPNLTRRCISSETSEAVVDATVPQLHTHRAQTKEGLPVSICK